MTINLNDPIALGGLRIKNRLIMAPLQQYKGTPEAFAGDHHIEHYGRRARHVGLVILESTAVSSEGRLWPNDIGIYSERHVDPLKKITDAVHKHDTPVFIQLSHGGRKSSPEVTNALVAPSAIAFDDHYGTPEALSVEGIKRVVEEYRLAAKRSIEAGFDGIELHAAHGFLIHQFASPLSNVRSDAYGGTSENRARFLKEVLFAVRGEVGRDYPVIVRISATDYWTGGLNPEEWARILKPIESQLDGIHVSSGGLLPVKPSDVYPAYQVPHAAAIKQHFNIPVIAVGKIYNRGLADRILEDRLADCIAIGSPLLEDPDYGERLLKARGDAN
ncbi:NADH:flavin oxidoreductase [Cohnella sp. CIP 111063]|uniref:oxidoreductase n=1 Tax=unclassified Cohnella TaxID=2636738 RepID=UPI000B8C37BA|nr:MULTISPECIES: NADH:flavin oxidoreductase [unclassified Cohnella]OXS58364.1 NADH:flavin oxidoreductase [Cohnella sp. CIP 111063]PRX71648.1 NADPH2 dehydrogenase [Cohnella sp. SGD-V74]